MSLTVVTVSGSLRDPEGNNAKGKVIFQLINEISETDSNEIITRRPVVKVLDASGDFSVNLYASNSSSSIPPSTAYRYTTQIEGAPIQEKFFVLDGGVSAINITDLLEIDPGSDLLTSPIMKIIRKPADETLNNTATLQNDDDLKYTLLAGETISFDFNLFVGTGPLAADIKFALNAPSGAVGRWGIVGLAPAATSEVGDTKTTSRVTFDGATSEDVGTDDTVATVVSISGTLINGGTPGDLQLLWAQQTATVGDTKVLTGSTLTVMRIF
jgi:hypothetical protein